MRNTNHHHGTRNRSLTVLLTIFLLAFSGALLPKGASAAGKSTVRTLHEWRQESREIIAISLRAYRLYKHCSQPPVMRACNSQ